MGSDPSIPCLQRTCQTWSYPFPFMAEYCAKCEAEHTIPYQHTQFNEKYHAYAASKKATLRIKRKPGETMEVDWL